MLYSCRGKGYRGSLPYYMRKVIYFPVFLSRKKYSTAIPKLLEVFLLWRRQTCKMLHPLPPAQLHSPEWTLLSDFSLLLPWPSLAFKRSSCSVPPSSGLDLTSLASPLVLAQALQWSIVPYQGMAPWELLLFWVGLQQLNVYAQAGTASSIYIHPALCIRALWVPFKSGLKSFHDMQLVGGVAIIKK